MSNGLPLRNSVNVGDYMDKGIYSNIILCEVQYDMVGKLM